MAHSRLDDAVRGLGYAGYAAYLNSPHWRKPRQDFLASTRYAGRCTQCGTADNLDVHHINYERLGQELPCDLASLCRGCHSRMHKPYDSPERRRADIVQYTERPPQRSLACVRRALRAARVLWDMGFYIAVRGDYIITDERELVSFAKDPYQFYLDHNDVNFANRMEWLDQQRE